MAHEKARKVKEATLFDIPPPAPRGGLRASQDINVMMLFVENKQGEIIGGHRAKYIRKKQRQIWNVQWEEGPMPKTWREANARVSEFYHREMNRAVPELALCEDNWKGEEIAKDNYSQWYRSKKNPVKNEDDDDDAQATVRKRSPSLSLAATTPPKKTKIEDRASPPLPHSGESITAAIQPPVTPDGESVEVFGDSVHDGAYAVTTRVL